MNSGSKILIFVIVCVVAFFVVKWLLQFRKKKNDIIVLTSGKLGGGKSFITTYDALSSYKESCKEWRRVNKPCFIVKLIRKISYFDNKNKQKESYGLCKPCLYSNYPIRINKNEYSKLITNDIMLLKEAIPLNSIVIIDEFSSWINQFQFNEKFSKCLNDHIQKWRHYHGNYSKLYVIDQSSDNIPLQVKRRGNKVLYCESVKHYLGFIHILNYKYIELTENIKTIEINETRDIENSDKADSGDKTSKRIVFGIKQRYDSRAYSNRYTYVNNCIENKCGKYINSKLKVNECLSTPKEIGFIIDNEIEKGSKENEVKK